MEMSNGNLFTRITQQNGISIMDTEGQVIYSHSYNIDSLIGIIAVRMHTDNDLFFVSGYRKDSCSHSGSSTIPFTHPAIGRMGLGGDVMALYHYRLGGPDCWGYPMDLLVTNTKDVITWGLAPAFFALKVDSSLAPVWAKRFSNNGGFQFIKELPGGDLLAGINMDTAGAVVARMDADGNFLWCKSYIRPRGMVHDAVIEPDGSFLITGFTDSTASTNPFIPYPPTYHPKLFMLKLNGQGEVQWCRGYDSAPNLWYSHHASRIVRTLDGNYAVLATLGYPQRNFFFRPYLMKTNLNGDTLWTRSMGADGFDYYTLDLLAYSDGGYIIDGGVWGDLPNMQTGLPYIFKTDSLGHFSCQDQPHPVQVLELFPIDSSFTLSSVDGATAHPAFVNDTLFDPIAVYDACIVTSVPAPVHSKARRVNIRPNPTTGSFTVEFTDPLSADSFYSVYDAVGKLLFQRPLATGQESEEIDLSRFGQGTYLVRITSKEGVCNERVVVQ